MRDVLESLLSGTELNFVIGASAANPQKVEAVFLLQRSTETATSAAADRPLTPARRAWLQSRLNGRPATLGDDNTPSAVDTSDIPAADDAMPDPSKAPASQATPGNSTPPASDTPVTTPTASTDTASATTSTASPDVNPDKSTSERIADMQQMFEQRRQITKTQNQGQPPTSNQSQDSTSTQP
jgi:hypothetical protein